MSFHDPKTGETVYIAASSPYYPKTGETLYFYRDNGWHLTTEPEKKRSQGYFVMECYVMSASETYTQW